MVGVYAGFVHRVARHRALERSRLVSSIASLCMDWWASFGDTATFAVIGSQPDATERGAAGGLKPEARHVGPTAHTSSGQWLYGMTSGPVHFSP
jgi:hypothetical protein